MAAGWTVQTDLADSEEDEWIDQTNQSTLNSDQTSWKIKATVLSPNASNATSILNFGGGGPEDFNVTPEDATITPEDIQDDMDSWMVQAEPN